MQKNYLLSPSRRTEKESTMHRTGICLCQLLARTFIANLRYPFLCLVQAYNDTKSPYGLLMIRYTYSTGVHTFDSSTCHIFSFLVSQNTVEL